MSNGNNGNNRGENCMCRQCINLAQQAVDERTTHANQMTDAYLNYLVDYPLNHPEEQMGLLVHCGLLGLFAIMFYYCWPLILFGCLLWCLLTFSSLSGRLSSSEPDYSVWMRDAESEGRTAQPTDEEILLSPTVQMPIPVQLSIQNTQAHDAIVLPNMNSDKPADPTSINVSKETNSQTFIEKSRTPPILLIAFNRISDAFPAIGSQDDIDCSDSSEEEDLIFSSDSDSDGDSECGCLENIRLRGHSSPTPLAHINSIENHANPKKPDLVNISTTDMNSSNALHNEAEDVEAYVNSPGDVIHESIVLARLKCVLTLKTQHRLQVDDKSIGVSRA